MYMINKSNRKASQELINEFSKFGVALIADSMGRYGAMKPYIKPIAYGRKMKGRAVTVQTYRSDNLMLHVALEMAQKGDVLVVDAGEITNAGLWGDLMTQMACIKGLNGVVTDGAVRDIEELIKSGLPIYSKSISPLGGFKSAGGSVNIRISCGGVVVLPGDIIIGDDDGVVVIPLEKAEEVLELCKSNKKKENAISKKMKQGITLFEQLGLPEQLGKLGLAIPEDEE
ncbi:4-carboxy-4-hydroxy-2-oxoadipate aldolase/oxaloacetate decarboxylase [Lutispora sp.]|uniref:4-carboxy-4-hydroxy-2-oxoadipate aldolase/oxaloacetate decarboxylase n=1 Tax=Lutispora sp. TaxID=2828727 RepID=UPI002B1F4177|nr:4-carboxy-4-hydroxy-2-oxoadipate aldolase/oxaloacetate decarboxylase [Lutispora sp.]MEA4962579.1 4-carboxy-4-hydroxy-2-oxoadipate aldolase/oxaloacetate decarboxylase [Lutispora sp.]